MPQDLALVPEVVLSIEKTVLTSAEEQEKWLQEDLNAVSTKAKILRSCIEEAPGFRDASEAEEGHYFIRVIHAAADMLEVLTTGLLSPRNYYELYVKVFDELAIFSGFLAQEHGERGRSLENIYEVVQYTEHILPRLYLLIVAGAVYIDAGEEPVLEILRDLIEMCKGVQHPTRGLFLRHFLLTMMKGKLPGDPNRPPDPRHGDNNGTADILKTAEFMIQNFKEMLWLWIRMETKNYQKSVNERNISPQRVGQQVHCERQEIGVFVGMNLERIAQLDGIDVANYEKVILPKLLSTIVRYQDPLAQQYLLEVMILVFPDEYHLATLKKLIQGTQNLTPGVDLRQVFQALMNRLGNHVRALHEEKKEEAEAGERVVEDPSKGLFSIFLEQFEGMAISYDPRPPMTLEIKFSNVVPPRSVVQIASYVGCMSSLIRMSRRISPAGSSDAQISLVLRCIAEKFFACAEAKGELPREAAAAAEELFLGILAEFASEEGGVRRLLEMETLTVLISRLPLKGRRAIARALAEAVLARKGRREGDGRGATTIRTIPHATQLFNLLDPLLCDQIDEPVHPNEDSGPNVDPEFIDDQQLVCCVLHCLDHEDAVAYLKMLSGLRRLLIQGGPRRIPHTLPTLAALYLRTSLRIYAQSKKEQPPTKANNSGDIDHAESEKEGRDSSDHDNPHAKLLIKALRHLHSGDGKGILEVLAVEAADTTLYTYLAAARVADSCEQADLSYEFFTEGLTLYEEYAANTHEQIKMLKSLINALHTLRNMPEENYEVFATKLCQHASRLLKKQDQSRMITLCATLFQRKTLSEKNHRRVEDCLQRALKIAQHVQSIHQLPLHVDLLNLFMHFYASKQAPINAHYIKTLLDRIHSLSAEHGKGPSPDDDAESNSKKAEPARRRNAVSISSEKDAASITAYVQAHMVLRNTIKYIQSRQSMDPRWNEIQI